MSLYPLLRPLLFLIPPETAHDLAIGLLRRGLIPPQRSAPQPSLAVSLWGRHFSSPVGLAAGFDKNAVALKGLFAQGFGFVEAGTVTPFPQTGNTKPRLFRLGEDEAIVNRLGFNNLGVTAFVNQLCSLKERAGVLGVNIGKNRDSGDAIGDYLKLLAAVYPYADYITVNVSSPNTAGLRALQEKAALTALLGALQEKRAEFIARGERQIPLLLKIAPDLAPQDAEDIAEVALTQGLEGLIISNTTIARPGDLKSVHQHEQGGLSGRPLFVPSTELLRRMYQLTQGRIPLVGVGGILSGADAYAKIKAGASLVQLYSGIIYRGFGLVDRVKQQLAALLARDGLDSVSQATGIEAR